MHAISSGTANGRPFSKPYVPLIAASRSEEGNIAYDLYEDVNEANAFCFIEKWKDPEAIAAHNASSHFREWMACKAEFVISGTVARYRIL